MQRRTDDNEWVRALGAQLALVQSLERALASADSRQFSTVWSQSDPGPCYSEYDRDVRKLEEKVEKHLKKALKRSDQLLAECYERYNRRHVRGLDR